MKNIKEKVLKEKNKCNWCGFDIGTNELKCLKCQGYLLCKEKVGKEINEIKVQRIPKLLFNPFGILREFIDKEELKQKFRIK